MTRKLCVLVALLALMAGTASAQTPQDARTVLQNSMKAMGGTDLKTIQYSGAGWSSMIGQTFGLAEDWPHYEVADYTRTVDYDAKAWREDYTRRQGAYPTMGRVPMPETHVTAILSGGYAWDMQGTNVVPQPGLYLYGVPYSDLRQLELVLTPHGFLKAAMASSDASAITLPIVGPSDFGLSQNGRKVTVVSFTMMNGKYKVNGTINDTVGKKYVITDGVREVQVLQVRDVAYELGDPAYRQGPHSSDMLMVYLPKEKILFNADLYTPPAQGAAPIPPTNGMRTLFQNIKLQKLDVTQHVPAHGRVGTQDEFVKLVGITTSSSN